MRSKGEWGMDWKKKILREESGYSLVVALMMILVLSVIGLAAAFNSNLEIRLSGNKRGATNAFYTADGGAQSVLADLANFSLPPIARSQFEQLAVEPGTKTSIRNWPLLRSPCLRRLLADPLR
jgi:type II secretory pathway component PulK